MDDGRKRVILIAASILLARHLKDPEDLGQRSSPCTESLIANAIHWAERIMKHIDSSLGVTPFDPALAFLAALLSEPRFSRFGFSTNLRIGFGADT
jgi:hypothetical protein